MIFDLVRPIHHGSDRYFGEAGYVSHPYFLFIPCVKISRIILRKTASKLLRITYQSVTKITLLRLEFSFADIRAYFAALCKTTDSSVSQHRVLRCFLTNNL